MSNEFDQKEAKEKSPCGDGCVPYWLAFAVFKVGVLFGVVVGYWIAGGFR